MVLPGMSGAVKRVPVEYDEVHKEVFVEGFVISFTADEEYLGISVRRDDRSVAHLNVAKPPQRVVKLNPDYKED